MINKRTFLKAVKHALDKNTAHARLLNLEAVKGIKIFISTDDLFIISNKKLYNSDDIRLRMFGQAVGIHNEAVKVVEALNSKGFDDVFFNGFIHSMIAFYGVGNKRMETLEKSIYTGLKSAHIMEKLTAMDNLKRFINGKIWTNNSEFSQIYFRLILA